MKGKNNEDIHDKFYHNKVYYDKVYHDKVYHEQILSNQDVEVKFSYSESEGNYVPPHWHDSLELVYVIEGRVTAKLPDQEAQSAGNNEFFVINSRIIHSIISERNRAIILQVPLMLLKKYVPFCNLLTFQVNMHPASGEDHEKLENVKRLFQEMYEVYVTKTGGYLLKFNSLLFELLYILIQSYTERSVKRDINKREKDFEQLAEILSYIELNHTRQITVLEMASLFHYNQDYFSRYFKKHMNISLTEYIYEVRLNYVYQEIVSSKDPIQDILNRHGCSNYRVAMKHFHRRFGCTPMEKRKEMQNR